MPSPYRKILVAIDGSDESAQVLSRAAGVLSGNDGELHLIHVIEPLALAYGADVPMDVTDLQSGLMKQAREMADKYAGQYKIPETNVYVDMGSIEKTILDKAD
ncbi:universal stress protein UspA, partial [Alcanivorax sp. HI0083]